jgi:phage shock protein A
MNALERITDLARALFNSETQLRHVEASVEVLRADLTLLETGVLELRERVTKLEAFREADRAKLDAEISRFKLDVERLLLASAARCSAGDPALPGSAGEAAE